MDMQIKKTKHSIPSPSGLPLSYRLYMPPAEELRVIDGRKQLMIFVHGFKGFAEWGFIPYVCQRHVEEGVIAVAIDFSKNGILDEKEMRYDVELFADNTVSLMLEELNLLIDHLTGEAGFFGSASEVDVSLGGHSLGAALSLITAAERNDIKNLVLWGSVGTLNRNTARQKELWKQKGRVEFSSRPGGQRLWQNYSYLEDKERNMARLDLEKRASEYKGNMLVLHGETDVTTRPKEGEDLYNAAAPNGNAKLLILPKTGHTFNSLHPMQEPAPPSVVKATEAMVNWVVGE